MKNQVRVQKVCAEGKGKPPSSPAGPQNLHRPLQYFISTTKNKTEKTLSAIIKDPAGMEPHSSLWSPRLSNRSNESCPYEHE